MSQCQRLILPSSIVLGAVGSIGFDPNPISLDVFDPVSIGLALILSLILSLDRLVLPIGLDSLSPGTFGPSGLVDLLLTPCGLDALVLRFFDPLLFLNLLVATLRFDPLGLRLFDAFLLVDPRLLAIGVAARLLTLGLDPFVFSLGLDPLLLLLRSLPLVQTIGFDARILCALRALLGQQALGVLLLLDALFLSLQSLILRELCALKLIGLQRISGDALPLQLQKVADALSSIGTRDRLDRHNLTSTWDITPRELVSKPTVRFYVRFVRGA